MMVFQRRGQETEWIGAAPLKTMFRRRFTQGCGRLQSEANGSVLTLGSELLTCRFDFGGRWKIGGLFSCVASAGNFNISHAPNATSHFSGRCTKSHYRDRL